MPTDRESICCREVLKVSLKAGITDHEGFSAICLNPHVIESAIYQYIDEERGYIDDRATFE